MITISGYCKHHEIINIQKSVIAAKGYFKHCDHFSETYYYVIEFDTGAGACYKTYHETLEALQNPPRYSEKTPGKFKKLKNKLVGAVKQLIH